MSFRRTLAAALLVLALTPAAARADTFFTPFIGLNFGGDSGKDLSAALDSKEITWGASLTWMGGGVFGVEGDLGYTSDFFGKTEEGGSSVLTMTGNLIVGLPFGGQEGFSIRPYTVGGIGILESKTEFGVGPNLDENSIAWDFGGGMVMFFSNHWGVRFDFRYFKSFDDVDVVDGEISDGPGKLDFSRFTTGVVIRF